MRAGVKMLSTSFSLVVRTMNQSFTSIICRKDGEESSFVITGLVRVFDFTRIILAHRTSGLVVEEVVAFVVTRFCS